MQLRLLDLVPPRVRNPYPTPKPEKESIVMKVGPRRNETYLSMAIMAIGKLASRTGSSSRAIITYLKANGYQFDNTKRSLHSMNRALKLGVSSGKLEKVKLSFKLTALAKHQSKAMEKMKAKHLREKEMARTKKAKETKKANKESTKESIEKEKPRKPIERKTKQPIKRKKPAKEVAAVPLAAKAAAIAMVLALLETPKTRKSVRSRSQKSIGTLAQSKTPRPSRRAVRNLVSAKRASKRVSSLQLNEVLANSTPKATLSGMHNTLLRKPKRGP